MIARIPSHALDDSVATANRFDPQPTTQLTDFQKKLDFDRIYVKGSPSPRPFPVVKDSIRILSWNIARGHQPARIASALCGIQPDIACLQEVDWGNARTDFADVLQFLAEKTGMLGLFGIEFIEINSPLRPRKLAGGGVTGNAILTRFEPSKCYRVDLPPCVRWDSAPENPRLSKWARRGLRREKRAGARCGMCAEFALGGKILAVCSIHLEDKAGGIAGRWSQFRAAVRALDVIQETPGTSVIAGDFNTFDCRVARWLSGQGADIALGKPNAAPEAAWWKSALLPRAGYFDPFPADLWTFSVQPFFVQSWIGSQYAQALSRLAVWVPFRHRIIAPFGPTLP